MAVACFTRRELLCTTATAALLAACSGSRATPGGLPAGISTGGAFVQPSELASVQGRLELTLTAEATMVPFGTGTRYAYTYNGSTPGPTLRVRPGDQVVLTLRNQLDHETNLHTHGLRVSPNGNSDNVFVSVAPGAEHTYTYDIPDDHPSGFFWYHPHAHGRVAEQIAAGMAGAIIVVDELDDIAEVAGSTERLWVLADPRVGSDAGVLNVSQMERMQGREGDVVVVNGVAQPTVNAVAGTLERWRFVNASASRYYRLAVDEHPMHVIASDGGRLPAPVDVTEIMLAPGERTELLISPTQPGSYTVRTLAYNRGSGGMGGGMGMGGGSVGDVAAVIATMVVTGTAVAAALPQHLALAVADDSMVAPARTLTLAMGMGGGGPGGEWVAWATAR